MKALRTLLVILLITAVRHALLKPFEDAWPPLDITDFLPSTDGLELSHHVLHEYVGAVWYALRRAVAG